MMIYKSKVNAEDSYPCLYALTAPRTHIRAHQLLIFSFPLCLHRLLTSCDSTSKKVCIGNT